MPAMLKRARATVSLPGRGEKRTARNRPVRANRETVSWLGRFTVGRGSADQRPAGEGEADAMREAPLSRRQNSFLVAAM